MQKPPPERPSRNLLIPSILGMWVVLSAEFLYFDLQTSRHYASVYPRWNDQIQYLTECYTGFEFARTHGFWAGLWHSLTNPSAQGTLHDFSALLVFSVAGPSRSAALSLNILALIAWQVALFGATLRTTRSHALAWSAAMLPLTLRWPWNGWAGSTADFRLDHFGMCAFGITSALSLLTDGFRHPRWSAVFGLAVGGTLLTRFITGPYFVLIFVVLFVTSVLGTDRKRRFLNLLLAALVATAVAGPILWINREWVLNYYWIGHFTGPESAIRDPKLGLAGSLGFVGDAWAREHLGAVFWWLAGAGVALLAVGVRTRDGNRTEGMSAPRAGGWIGAIFLLAPAVVLTLHRQKSSIVIGVLAPGTILLVLAAWRELLARTTAQWPRTALAIVAMATAGTFFVSRQLSPVYDAAFAADARKVNQLAGHIFEQAQAAGLKAPRVGVDQVTDCLDGQVLRVIVYERHHAWVPFVMTLPTGIAAEKEALLLERLENSDFVFLTEEGPVGNWPYDVQMRALLPRTTEWCASHLRLVERFELFGRRMVLYQRRDIP